MGNVCRILLADDDPTVQRAALRVATEFGHEVVQVRTGMAVLAITMQQKPDLIVLDIGFPDADVETCSRSSKQTCAPRRSQSWSGRLGMITKASGASRSRSAR